MLSVLEPVVVMALRGCGWCSVGVWLVCVVVATGCELGDVLATGGGGVFALGVT